MGSGEKDDDGQCVLVALQHSQITIFLDVTVARLGPVVVSVPISNIWIGDDADADAGAELNY